MYNLTLKLGLHRNRSYENRERERESLCLSKKEFVNGVREESKQNKTEVSKRGGSERVKRERERERERRHRERK